MAKRFLDNFAFGRLRTSSGIFGNDCIVFKNASTPRIKIKKKLAGIPDSPFVLVELSGKVGNKERKFIHATVAGDLKRIHRFLGNLLAFERRLLYLE